MTPIQRGLALTLMVAAATAKGQGIAENPRIEPASAPALRAKVAEQAASLEVLKRLLAQQELQLNEIRQQLEASSASASASAAPAPAPALPGLARVPDAGPASSPTAEPSTALAPPSRTEAVGAARSASDSVPTLALFEQPGVLTGRGKVVIEPSIQYSYSSSNRVALVGYTVIPSILVGVVDVREVKRSSFIGAMTARFGVTNRLEIEGKVPYVHRSDTSIGRELLQGTSTSSAFDAAGQGLGDIEVTARYQLNSGGADQPYYVGSLRLKSRTGKDPFQVMTTKSVVGFTNEGIQNELPTGSGFYGIQPALTVLYPSDPAVFFGTLSYLHSVKRDNVVRNTDAGPEALGQITPGGIIGFNFGMGLALNDKSSFSIGYDHSSVGRTRLNGAVAADSVRLQLGTLLLGYSLKLSPERSMNVSLGAGLTRDTPDITLSLRVPTTF